jgi:hypothetical protein
LGWSEEPKNEKKKGGNTIFCRTTTGLTGIVARAAIAAGVGFGRFISTWAL